MKAVIYHADGPIAKNFPPDTYCKLFEGFKKNAAEFGLDTIHLTLEGHPGWGDENYYFPNLDPADIVYNREIAWLEFLKQSDPNETYWLTEPDARINELWPPLDCDLALLIRGGDPVRITPSWRIARKSSVKFFEDIVEYFDNDNKTWHGDSTAFVRIWNAMGQPDIGRVNYNGINIDLRNYKEYSMTKSKFSRQFKADNKLKLLGL
jgi:hypothetical protein